MNSVLYHESESAVSRRGWHPRLTRQKRGFWMRFNKAWRMDFHGGGGGGGGGGGEAGGEASGRARVWGKGDCFLSIFILLICKAVERGWDVGCDFFLFAYSSLSFFLFFIFLLVHLAHVTDSFLSHSMNFLPLSSGGFELLSFSLPSIPFPFPLHFPFPLFASLFYFFLSTLLL